MSPPSPPDGRRAFLRAALPRAAHACAEARDELAGRPTLTLDSLETLSPAALLGVVPVYSSAFDVHLGARGLRLVPRSAPHDAIELPLSRDDAELLRFFDGASTLEQIAAASADDEADLPRRRQQAAALFLRLARAAVCHPLQPLTAAAAAP